MVGRPKSSRWAGFDVIGELVRRVNEALTSHFPLVLGVDLSCQSVLRHHSVGSNPTIGGSSEIGGPRSPAPLEYSRTAVAKSTPRAALSLLQDCDGDRPTPQWRYQVVAVEQTGRIALPPGARHVLGTDGAGAVAALTQWRPSRGRTSRGPSRQGLCNTAHACVG